MPPDKFVDELPLVLADAPPLPGEEARYAQVLAVLEATKTDPKLKQAMTEGARDVDFYRTKYGSQQAYEAKYTSRDGKNMAVYLDENGKVLSQKELSSKK